MNRVKVVSSYCTISELNAHRQVCKVALAGSTCVLHRIHNLWCFTQLLAPLTSGSEAPTQLWLVVRGWKQNYTTIMFKYSTASKFLKLNVWDFNLFWSPILIQLFWHFMTSSKQSGWDHTTSRLASTTSWSSSKIVDMNPKVLKYSSESASGTLQTHDAVKSTVITAICSQWQKFKNFLTLSLRLWNMHTQDNIRK